MAPALWCALRIIGPYNCGDGSAPLYGRQFDAVRLHPRPGTTLDVALRHPRDATDALAKIPTPGTPADIDVVRVAGQVVTAPAPLSRDGSLSPMETR
jgi:hypothetical protein